MDKPHKILLESKYKSIELVPLNDLHLGSYECDEGLVDNTINYIRHHKNCYTFLGGDIIECNVYGKANNVHTEDAIRRTSRKNKRKIIPNQK